MQVLWFLTSHCLYDETPLKDIQAALPINLPLEEMSQGQRSAAMATLCRKAAKAWRTAEMPELRRSPAGAKVRQRMENLDLLCRPAGRRTEIFIRPDNSDDWYHQGAISPGGVGRTCHFGALNTRPDTGFHIIAITTDAPVPHQGGGPTKPLPRGRMRSEEVRVIRS
jgi:hypothetical protein